MYARVEREVALAVLHKPDLSQGDIQAISGYLFDTGLASREEAEMLFAVDRSAAATVEGWREFFIEAVTDFVVWQQRPTGRITESDADWLIACLGDTPSINGRALLFRLLSEAHDMPMRLVEAGLRYNQRKLSRA